MGMLAPEDSTLSYAIWSNPPTLNSVLHIYTEILLVSLPTPDFSMPYNVICLACTVAALAFSPIHNITTKTLSLAQSGEVQGGLLSRLLNKLRALLGKKKQPAVTEEEETAEKSEEDEKEKED